MLKEVESKAKEAQSWQRELLCQPNLRAAKPAKTEMSVPPV